MSLMKKILKAFVPEQAFWLPRYYEALQWIPCRKDAMILDAGCGEGIISREFIKRGMRVVGVDISLEKIRQAESSFGKEAKFTLSDLGRLPLKDGLFDYIASLDTLEYLKDDLLVFQEFFRVLKPKGRVILSITHNYVCSAEFFCAQRRLRKLIPKALYSRELARGKAWLEIKSMQDIWKNWRVYSIESLEEKIARYFTITRHKYALRKFSALAMDIAYGIKGMSYFKSLFFWIAVRLDGIFGADTEGYTLVVELTKKIQGIDENS